MGFTCRPSGVSSPIAWRRMSPVAMCGRPYSAAIRFACVPFPAPCGPSSNTFTFTLLEEAFVAAHHHLRLHLPHRVERDADDDQDRRAAEGARGRLREAEVADEQARRDGDDSQVERAREGKSRQHAVEVLRRRGAGPDAWDVAAVLAQVV